MPAARTARGTVLPVLLADVAIAPRWRIMAAAVFTLLAGWGWLSLSTPSDQLASGLRRITLYDDPAMVAGLPARRVGNTSRQGTPPTLR
jgi:hypothetical protein